MTAPRPVQPSMFPDSAPDRPVGPLLGSVQTGTNADLIARVAPLYLTGSVLDVTYGEGKWWDRFTPDPFTYHDRDKVDGVDFTALPEADRSVDTVCFDPPYVAAGGRDTSTAGNFQDRYGIGGTPQSTVHDMALLGLAEVCRVARQFVLVKCMEFVVSSEFCDMPTIVTNAAAECGWRVHDRIVHHGGSGPGGHNIFTAKRARRHHSYLLVFTPARLERPHRTALDLEEVMPHA